MPNARLNVKKNAVSVRPIVLPGPLRLLHRHLRLIALNFAIASSQMAQSVLAILTKLPDRPPRLDSPR